MENTTENAVLARIRAGETSKRVDVSAALAQARKDAEPCGFSAGEMIQLEHLLETIRKDDARSAALGILLEESQGDNVLTAMHADPGFGRGFDLVYLLCLLPRARKMYQENGWTEAQLQGIQRDIKLWVDNCVWNEGVFGVSRGLFSEFYWICGQMLGSILRFGRLQCNVPSSGFSKDARFYRSRKTGKYILLLDGEHGFLADGLSALEGEIPAFKTAPIREGNGKVTGYASNDRGYVAKEPVTLDLNEWELILKPGDKAINFHIPADGPMTWELCKDSFRQMWAFYQKRGEDVKAVICGSWILDPQFPSILPERSNLVQLQKHGYLYPGEEESVAIERVLGFKAAKEGVDTVPARTTMQKCFVDFVHKGGKFRDGRIVIMPEEFLEK